MKIIARKNILDVKPYIPGKPIEEVQRELGLKRVIKLASNENPYGPSPAVLKAIAQKAKTINRYPDGDCFYLRQELSKQLKVKGNQIIFGNGSDEIIVAATRAFTNEGDEVIVARPSFLIYEIASKISGADVKFVELKDFRYDLRGMREAVSEKTKIIFIGNPDNPAGTYINKKDLVGFLEGLNPRIVVFMDEAYHEFVRKKDYPQTIPMLKDYPNLLITRTFSKIYGLAGLRIGYGVSHPETVGILERIREPFNVNSLAQAAALACLKDKAYYQRMGRDIEGQRQFLYGGFRRLKVPFVDTVTNFILVKVGRDSFAFTQGLLKKGIIVRDMGVWGLSDYIRVTIGTREENKRLLAVLKELLS